MRRCANDAVRCLSRGLGQWDAAAASGCRTAVRTISSATVPLPQLSSLHSGIAGSPCSSGSTGSPWSAAAAAASQPSGCGAPFAASCAFAQQQQQHRSATTSAGGNPGGAQQQVERQAAKRALAPRAVSGPPMQLGIVHIQSSSNNTILTLTDEAGNTKAWASAGALGFKNARKSTSYAAEAAAEKLAADARRLGIGQVQLRIRGLGQGKQSSIKTLHASGLIITAVHECTPLPHNGCRPPKKRRI